jgi:hypothetical protein
MITARLEDSSGSLSRVKRISAVTINRTTAIPCASGVIVCVAMSRYAVRLKAGVFAALVSPALGKRENHAVGHRGNASERFYPNGEVR